MKVAILLLAAGRGSRFGGPVPKAYLRLDGKPLLLHSAERLAIAAAPLARWQLVVVTHPDDAASHLAASLHDLQTLGARSGGLALALGGSTRQESMARGLDICDADTDLVLVHDAARPLLPVAATRECLRAAAERGAALLAVPAADTLKRVREGVVEATVDRAGMWLAQTPQVIRRDLLRRALDHAAATGFHGTDDVSLVEHLGEPVAVVLGSPHNLKITRPEDLPLAVALLAAGLT